MRIVPLDHVNLPAFCEYCLAHRLEHDESYLDPQDLTGKVLLSPHEGPSFLLLGDSGTVIGAVSLMLARFRSLHKGRFRILHAAKADPEHYRTMIEAVLPFARQLETVYLFLPRECGEVGAVLKGLGFAITRYAFLLERPAAPPIAPNLPASFSLRSFRPGADESAWCNILNAAFAPLPAHVDLTPEMLQHEFEGPGYLEDGLIMLLDAGAPIGLVRVTREEDEDGAAFIEQLAVAPAYQHRGLGRQLLRTAVEFGAKSGLPVSRLSVNAENEKAFALYRSEGFEEKQAMLCYEFFLSRGASA